MIEAMQQTDKYKLNKPGVDDPITPVPLNENADKIEAALSDAAARITALEAHRIVVGSYTGNEADRTIALGFTPIAVLVCNASGTSTLESSLIVTGSSAQDQYQNQIVIVGNGFRVTGSYYPDFNREGVTYNYIAFA